MRPLTADYRLQALSVLEIADKFEDVTKVLAKAHKFNRRKLKPGPMLNALVLWFLELPELERSNFAGRSLARLESVLAETDEERSEAAGHQLQISQQDDGSVGQTDAPKDYGKSAKPKRRMGKG